MGDSLARAVDRSSPTFGAAGRDRKADLLLLALEGR
jgi:hypothetical protein